MVFRKSGEDWMALLEGDLVFGFEQFIFSGLFHPLSKRIVIFHSFFLRLVTTLRFWLNLRASFFASLLPF